MQYLEAFCGDNARPTILEVLACLAKDFGVPYESAILYAAYVQSQRAARSSGRDYLRTLTTAQRNMQAAGILLTLSPAEQRYFMCELGLSAPQQQTFLAQLSGRANVSNDYLQSLSPDTAVCRSKSLLNPQDSDERLACFASRLVLIEAFLHHDPGDGKAARAAVTMGAAEYDPDSAPLAPLATASTPTPAMTAEERAARARVLKADWQVRSSTLVPTPHTWQRTRPCTTDACRLRRVLAALRIRCRRRLQASGIGSASTMARMPQPRSAWSGFRVPGRGSWAASAGDPLEGQGPGPT
jgi:hypothetical protein